MRGTHYLMLVPSVYPPQGLENPTHTTPDVEDQDHTTPDVEDHTTPARTTPDVEERM